jgi:hypothetical protein
MKHAVFIQTNHKQIVGAIVAEHALRRYSTNNDKFEVHIVNSRDYPFFLAREGQEYMRDGVKRVWLNEDLQSFTPTRFMPPELMGYEGRAVVIDPDVFACADIWELLNRDMKGKAVMARMRSGTKGLIDKAYASSVMLLDCAQLKHWKVEEQFNAMFDGDHDYSRWIGLRNEDPTTLEFIENEWNDFDKFTTDTKMLHTTRRKTQPWKTGLPVDWRPAERFRLFPPAAWVLRLRRKIFGEYGLMGNYKVHPDKNQENFFWGLVKECVEQGKLTEEFLRQEMKDNHVRHDALEVIARVPSLPPAPAHPLSSGNLAKAA